MDRPELYEEILWTLGPYLGTFPVEDMVREYIETYGIVSVRDVPEDEYHALIEKHDRF